MMLAYQGKSCISHMIEWFTWSKYSHVSWSFAHIENGEVCGCMEEFEAWTKGGVERVPVIGMNHNIGTRVDLYELRTPLTLVEESDGRKYLVSKLGKKYDYAGIFGFMLRKKLSSDNRLFCAHYIFDFFLSMGRRLLNGVEGYQITPGGLCESPELVYRGYIIIGKGWKVRHELSVKVLQELLNK